MRARAGVAAVAAALILLLTAAAPTDTQTPPSSPPPGSRSDPSAAPPAITLDPLPAGLVTLLPLPVSGSADPGALVHVSGGAASTAAARCDATAGSDGRWSCALVSLPDGPGVVVRAVPDPGGPDATGRVDVLSPPTLTAGDGPQHETAGGVRGTAYPGATVTVRADTGAGCSVAADGSGVWGCVLSLPIANGRHTITASQVAPFSTDPSRSTAPVTIIVDTTAPAPPVITSPAGALTLAPGSIAFTGSGEAGGAVTVYASDSRTSAVLCTAVVSGTAWSCTATIPAGRYLVSALQRDAAGNVSGGSNAFGLTVVVPGPSTSGPSGVPSTAKPGSRSATPAPAAPAVPPAATPTPSPPADAGGPLPDAPDWVRTPFSTATAPVVTADAIPGWVRSVLLALAAVLLLALPARLLARTMARGRTEHPRAAWSVFGRNRSAAELAESRAEASAAAGTAESEASPKRNPWLIPAGLAATAALVMLSSPVPDAGAYLRVVLAIVLALAVVNGVWVVVARWLGPHWGAGHAELVFRPAMLIIVAVAAVGSRIFELQPALVCGLVVGVRLAIRIGRVPRGRIAAAQIAALAALGVSAWSVIGVLPTPAGPVSAFLTETVEALALLSLGSAAVALLPVGGLAGRAVFQWSRLLWLGLGLVVYTLLFALLLPVASLIPAGQSTLLLVIGALGFAAVSVCLWLWERYVEPSR